MDELEISDDAERVDIDVVHQFLSSSYWAKDRSKAAVEKSVENSLCFSGFVDGNQVAFGRVITDRVIFGFIADVFVLEEHRGNGYGEKLIDHILKHPDVKDLRLTVLGTRDAHKLYEKYGFKKVPGSDKMMSMFAHEWN